MVTRKPTRFAELNAVLADLVNSARSILANSFVGAYLHGSFAIGDVDEHADVDFAVGITRQLNADEVDALQTMHRQIFDLPTPWAQRLEGSYFPIDALRRTLASNRCTPIIAP